MKDGNAGIIARENGQLRSVPVDLLGQIAQADALGGNIVDPCSDRKTAIGYIDGGVDQWNAGMLPVISCRQRKAFLALIISDEAEKGENDGAGGFQSPSDNAKHPLEWPYR